MKKSKIIVLVLTIAMIVGMAFATAIPASAEINEADWIEKPSKTLVKCPGGECDHMACDYVYSFAVIGDTQNLNYRDAQNYTAALAENPNLTYADFTSADMRVLYNWLLDNKEAKNIEYVLGMGDITQSFNVNQTYYDEEWPLAKEALSLLDGKLGYSLVRGNHDISSGMNGAFGVGNRYYNDLAALAATNDAENRPMAGFLNLEKVEDTYRKIVTSTGDKYIIFTLDFFPTEACVEWVDEILGANHDYTAIITLHAFLNSDATFYNEFEIDTAEELKLNSNWAGTATGGDEDAISLWENALKKHENVKFIFSGHTTGYASTNTQLRGDNGNTVTAMLVDAQGLDSYAPIGMITMIYLSADGSVVNVENFSPIRLAEGKNAYYMDEHQFELTVDYGDEWTATEYGNVPSCIFEDTAYTFHVLLDDDANADTANVYYGSYATWDETLTAIHAWNGKGNASDRANKKYNIVMSQDYTFSDGIPSNKSGQFPGSFNLDFNGKTMTLSGNGVLVPFYNGYNGYVPSFTIQNGNLIMAGNTSSHLAVLQTSSAGETVIDLNIKDLNVSYNASKTSLVGVYAGNASNKGSVNLNVTNCNMDMSGASGAVTLFALNDTNNNNNVSLNITGSSIIGTTSENLNIYTLNSGDDTAKFSPDENGDYITVSLNDNTAPIGIFRNEEGKLLNFVTESAEAPYVFTTELAPVEESAYGYIPTDVYPADTYPFVLFQNGEIVAAYTTWYEFCQNIYSISTAADKNTVLYLRESITVDKTSNQLRNVKNLTIDLGGNTVTSSVILFNFMADGNYDFTTNINVKNGTITATAAWTPIMAYNSANTSDVKCCFNTVFDGVTMSASSDFTGRLLVEAFKDGTYGTTNTVTLNNCIFDATVGSVSKLFQLEESNSQNKVDVAININGGKLIANSYFTIGTFSAERTEGDGSPDTLTFGKDSDGNEFSLEMPSTVAHPTTGIVTTNGDFYPMETVDDGTIATYYFKSIETDYGTISTANLSVVDYPFVLFKNDAQIHAAKSWYTLIQTDFVKNSAFRSGATLLVRRDYNTTEAGKASQNLYYIQDLTIDLDGHTLTRGSYHLFQAMEKHTTARRIAITVKNGTLVSKGSPIISFNDHADSTVISGYDFIFENVTFNLSAGKNLSNCYTNGDEGMSNSITLNNCTVDMGSYTKALTIFSLSESSGNKQDVAVTINGGKIISNSLSNLTLAAFSPEREEGNGSPDSLKFGTYNGNYVSFVTKTGNSAPTYDFVTVNGSSVSFADVSTSTNAIYQLGEDVQTDYGVIPYAYTDIEKYPIILFKDGAYLGNNTLFSAGYKAAVSESGADVDTVVVVLMRKDLTEALSASLSDANTIRGTVIVDLGGNTYTTSKKALFQFNANNSTNNPKIELRNGRINTIRLIAFANQTTAVCQKYDVLFKNVTLGFTSGTWNSMISTNQTASSDGYYALANVTFEDCVFDLKSNQSFASYKLLDLSNDTNNHAVNAIFKGGEFILGDYTFTLATVKSGYSDNTNFIEGESDSDTVKFEKGTNGYTVFTLPSGVAAPTNVYDSTELTFVKVSDNGTEAIYNLMPAAAVSLDFTPKTSITLGSELVYNIYVPATDYLKSYTVDGELYENAELVTLDDGNSYYRIAVPMAASAGARNIVLRATVTVDGKDYTGSWTMSIPKYAKKVIETGASEEVTLVKDVLAYIRAAYVYFDSEGKNEAVAVIDEILGDYSSAFEKVAGQTDTEAGLHGVIIILEAKPAVRFILPVGSSAENYTFKSGNKTLEYTTGSYTEGDVTYTYAEVKLYAYQLIGEITYTDGEHNGSYHINSYYDFVTTDEAYKDNANLITLVEKLYNYCKSAEAYRASVANS